MLKSIARGLVRTIQAPLPTAGGTLYVEGVPADKWDDREYVRRMVAQVAVRVALEKGCARIVVRHPTRDPIAFDVAEILLGTWRTLHGFLPAPPVPHPQLATLGFQGRGAEIATTRPTFTVPGDLTRSTPVSGLDPGG